MHGLLASLRSELKRSNLTPWIALFFALHLAVTQFGGMNALSRIAGMRAITEGHTLSIDNYKEWTVDWSQAPDGHYYSNKAPGAALLGLPIFALIDAPTRWLQAEKRDEKGRAPQPPYFAHLLLNLLTQMIPFALLVLFIGQQLRREGISQEGILFFGLAALFGNTAAIYLNCYFGHGMAALFFLAGYFCWCQAKYWQAGLFLAATALTDYGGACVVPAFLLATIWRERGASLRPLLWIGIGAIPCAVLWVWYHSVAFGSPFAVASAFIDPAQIEKVADSATASGAISLFPSLKILAALLFGTERGILFTQPWVFAAVVGVGICVRGPKKHRGTGLFLLGGLLGLLWMNASVGGWHGGWTLGPRYLSLLFPAFALALAWRWDESSRWLKIVAWSGVAVSLVFRLFTYPFSNLAPLTNLWAYHAQQFFLPNQGTEILRLCLALCFSALATYWAIRRHSKDKAAYNKI